MKEDKKHTARRSVTKAIMTVVAVLAVAGGSYWYVRQSAEKQEHIQDKTGEYLDRTARIVGGAVSNAAEKVRTTDWGKSASSSISNVAERVGGAKQVVSEKVKGLVTQKSHCYAGMPRPTKEFLYKITLIKNAGFTLGYCEEIKSPAWVAYSLFRVDDPERPGRMTAFQVDTRTTARIKPDDYDGTGYDRAQLAPSYAITTRYGPACQAETFLMSNVIPLKSKLYRRPWRDLETKVVKDYVAQLAELWIVTGPAYYEGFDKLPCGVKIPNAVFKIIVDEDEGVPRVLAFMIDQGCSGREPIETFLTSVDEIEKVTGLDFFPRLADDTENTLESSVATNLW